jgi:hypothetical protein
MLWAVIGLSLLLFVVYLFLWACCAISADIARHEERQ